MPDYLLALVCCVLAVAAQVRALRSLRDVTSSDGPPPNDLQR